MNKKLIIVGIIALGAGLGIGYMVGKRKSSVNVKL